MSGREERNQNLNNTISAYLAMNNDKPYLSGFYYFLTNTSLTTAYQYIKYIKMFMDFNQKKDVKDLSLDDYAMYMNHIKTFTPSYQIAIYSALKKFSLYLQASNRNNNDFMQYIARPKAKERQSTIQKRERGYLAEEEIIKYIDNVKNGKKSDWKYRDLAVILVFLNTGIRESALCQLDVTDIDFNNNTLIVTDKGDKVISYPLSDSIIDYLVKWLEIRKEILGDIDTNALFISSHKTRMDKSSVYRLVKKYGVNIEGKEISPHKLRATYGTQLYEATKDIVLVQNCMNHNSPVTTRRYIRGKNDEAKKMAADIMSKLTFS